MTDLQVALLLLQGPSLAGPAQIRFHLSVLVLRYRFQPAGGGATHEPPALHVPHTEISETRAGGELFQTIREGLPQRTDGLEKNPCAGSVGGDDSLLLLELSCLGLQGWTPQAFPQGLRDQGPKVSSS